MLWHIRIEPAPGELDRNGELLAVEAVESGLAGIESIRTAAASWSRAGSGRAEVERAASAVLVDPVVETCSIHAGRANLGGPGAVVHVMPKPGVTDPEAESALALLRDLGYASTNVRTIRTYRVAGPPDSVPRLDPARAGQRRRRAGRRRPACPSITSARARATNSSESSSRSATWTIRRSEHVSRSGQLSLSLAEMKAIQRHFAELGREPTDCELETLAQTWSEHCSHKTLRGPDRVSRANDRQPAQADDLRRDPRAGVRLAGERLRRQRRRRPVRRRARRLLQGRNAQPSLGHRSLRRRQHGAGRRDPRCARHRAGRQADLQHRRLLRGAAGPAAPSDLPAGVLHPRRVLKGVVAGVRDYGNRMGIPTVNGALAVDPGYLANPLVFCGTVGVLPRGMAIKKVEAGDRIVAIGGRTGRDGIHGATFSSIELTAQSEAALGRVPSRSATPSPRRWSLDVILQARDQGLFRAITDCGAGGFSSAVGEMGAELGAEVELERAPLKYQGLSYTEIWISEAQERMVLAVPPEKWPALSDLCRREDVEATDLGRVRRHRAARASLSAARSSPTCRWTSCTTGGRRSSARRPGRRQPCRRGRRPDRRRFHGRSDRAACSTGTSAARNGSSASTTTRCRRARSSSRWWARSDDGPGDAAVVLPVRGSTRGLAVACGINPRYGKLDPYAMAGCVIDEAIRNCVAVGADPSRDRAARQFLLGQHRAARDPGLARARRAGLPRRRAGLRHALHLGQGQPEQRIHARGTEPGDPADSADQRDRPGPRRAVVRDDGPEGTGQRAPARWA